MLNRTGLRVDPWAALLNTGLQPHFALQITTLCSWTFSQFSVHLGDCSLNLYIMICLINQIKFFSLVFERFLRTSSGLFFLIRRWFRLVWTIIRCKGLKSQSKKFKICTFFTLKGLIRLELAADISEIQVNTQNVQNQTLIYFLICHIWNYHCVI